MIEQRQKRLIRVASKSASVDFFGHGESVASTPQSPKISGRETRLITGSASALRTISGPIPAGSPMVMAMIGLLDMI